MGSQYCYRNTEEALVLTQVETVKPHANLIQMTLYVSKVENISLTYFQKAESIGHQNKVCKQKIFCTVTKEMECSLLTILANVHSLLIPVL